MARREGRCEWTNSALGGTLRSAPTDEGLENNISDDEVTHAASQGCLPTPYVTLNAERSDNAAPNGGCS